MPLYYAVWCQCVLAGVLVSIGKDECAFCGALICHRMEGNTTAHFLTCLHQSVNTWTEWAWYHYRMYAHKLLVGTAWIKCLIYKSFHLFVDHSPTSPVLSTSPFLDLAFPDAGLWLVWNHSMLVFAIAIHQHWQRNQDYLAYVWPDWAYTEGKTETPKTFTGHSKPLLLAHKKGQVSQVATFHGVATKP